jgi:putative peptide zinc metalloprotease protein
LYGFFSPIYRMIVTIGLIWFVAEKYFFFGVLMAMVSVWTSIFLPLWKGWKHVHQGGTLSRYRDQAQRRLRYFVIAFLLCLMVIPIPFYSIHQAVVWLPDDATVRAEVAGNISAPVVSADQSLQAGQTILMLQNSEIAAQAQVSRAEVESLTVRIRKNEVDDLNKADELRRELKTARVKANDLQRQADALVVHAPIAGHWVPAQHNELQGRYVIRGEIIGYMVAGPSRVMRVAVTQDDMSLIQSRLSGVQTRLSTQLNRVIDAHISRVTPDGSETLLSAALGSSAGGAIPVDPAQQEGTKALQRVFDIELTLNQPVLSAIFGDRCYVRFDLGWAGLRWVGSGCCVYDNYSWRISMSDASLARNLAGVHFTLADTQRQERGEELDRGFERSHSIE